MSTYSRWLEKLPGMLNKKSRRYYDGRDTMTYTRDNVDVTLVDDGETLTWRIHRNFPSTVYDVGVKVGS